MADKIATCEMCAYQAARRSIFEKAPMVCPHTTANFKVGDKVHVVPEWPTSIKYCIRAVAISIDECYHLKAFLQDLPGVWMFNIWDKDLMPRADKKRVPTPPENLMKPLPGE